MDLFFDQMFVLMAYFYSFTETVCLQDSGLHKKVHRSKLSAQACKDSAWP